MARSFALSRTRRSDEDLLAIEAQRLDERIKTAQGRVLTIIGIGAAALALIATQVPDVHLKGARLTVYAALPVVWVLIMGMVIMYTAEAVYLSYHLRWVLRALGTASKQPKAFIAEDGLAHRVYSVRTGVGELRLVYVVMLVGAAAAYISLVAFSVYGLRHEGAPVLVLAIAVIFAFGTSFVMLSGFYAVLHKIRIAFLMNIAGVRRYRKLPSIERFALWLLIPRPDDLVIKGSNYAIGVIAAFLIIVIYDRSSVATGNISHWTAVIVAFVAYDGLVSQAKYMINDTRDRATDRYRLGKQRKRFLVTFRLPDSWINVIAVVTITKIIGAMILAVYMLVAHRVITLVIGVAIAIPVQILYEAYAKPRGGLRRLGVASSNYVVRAAIGYEVASRAFAGGAEVNWQALGWVGAWSFVFAGVFLLGWWRAEAENDKSRGRADLPRDLVWFGTGAARRAHALAIGASCIVSGALVFVLTDSAAGRAVGGLAGLLVACGAWAWFRRQKGVDTDEVSANVGACICGVALIAACGCWAWHCGDEARVWSTCLPLAAAGIGSYFYFASYRMLTPDWGQPLAWFVVSLARAYRWTFGFRGG